MKRFKNWKLVALASILPLLAALQPTLTYACSAAGSHGGC